MLERTVRELNGESCISLEEAPPPNSRLSAVAAAADHHLRKEMRRRSSQRRARGGAALSDSTAGISAPSSRHPFAVNEPYYGNVATEKLTWDIIAAAVRSLDRIWLDGHRYAKAGIMLFSPNGVAQLNLPMTQPRPHSDALMKVLTALIIPDSGKSGLPDGVLRRTGR